MTRFLSIALVLSACRTSEADIELLQRVTDNEMAVAAMAEQIAALQVGFETLDTLVIGGEGDGLTVMINAVQDDVDGIAGDVAGNTTDISANADGISANADGISANADGISANADGISANSGALSANSSAITSNTDAITALVADYLTSTDLAVLQGEIAVNTAAIVASNTTISANASDVAAITADYLPWIDDVSTYLDADTTNAKIEIAGAGLDVDNGISTGMQFSGKSVNFRTCTGGTYSCTPTACMSLCQSNDERMAFVDEIYAWASLGQSRCAYAWMLQWDAAAGVAELAKGYPMYNNRTTSGCGTTNTGNVPRIEGFSAVGASWNATSTYDCACATIK